MGMFNYVKCEYPLPDAEAQDLTFQTKTFDCYMEDYTITAEGRLIQHVTRCEEVPDEERPCWGKPEWEDGISHLFGSVRRVPVRDVEKDYHGDLFFYAFTEAGKWYEYRARFTHGQLEAIARLGENAAGAEAITPTVEAIGITVMQKARAEQQTTEPAPALVQMVRMVTEGRV